MYATLASRDVVRVQPVAEFISCFICLAVSLFLVIMYLIFFGT